MTRAQEIVQFVQEQRNSIWDACDQGRWAYAIGWTLQDNPHLRGTAAAIDWRRGWNAEGNRLATP